MIQLVKTSSENKDFITLVKLLDQDLKTSDGADYLFYKQFNKIDNIEYVIVAYSDGSSIGCGAIKPYNGNTMEVKRMFVKAEMRGQGIAGNILKELENWAKTLGYTRTILETGKKQPEALRLYEKSNYKIIPNYGQYIGVINSVCMIKKLDHSDEVC